MANLLRYGQRDWPLAGEEWDPPVGVTSVRAVLSGGRGGWPGASGAGGRGAIITDTFAVSHGTPLHLFFDPPGGRGGQDVGPTAHGAVGGTAARIDDDLIAGAGGGRGVREGGATAAGGDAGLPGDPASGGTGGSGTGGAGTGGAGDGQDWASGGAGGQGEDYTGGSDMAGLPGGGGGGFGGGAGGQLTYDALAGEYVGHPGFGGGSKGGTSLGYATADWPVIQLFFAGQPGTPVLLGPDDDGEILVSEPRTFRWSHTPAASGDPEDMQTAYELEYRLAGGAWQTTGLVASTDQFHVFAASFFAPGAYEWRVTTYADGRGSNPSPVRRFVAADQALPPTITSPEAMSTVSAVAIPVAWTAPTQTQYQVQIVEVGLDGGPDETAVLYDSDEHVAAITSLLADAAESNRDALIRVRVRGTLTDWSAWTLRRVTLDDPQPDQPGVMLATDGAGLVVTVTNPATGTAVKENRVFLAEDGAWQRVAIIEPDGQWIYSYPRSGASYAARVEAVADPGPGATSSEVVY